MATRLQLKNAPSGIVEYAPIINRFSNGYTGVASSDGYFQTEQFGGGYRLAFSNDDLNNTFEITTSSPTTLIAGVQYLVKVKCNLDLRRGTNIVARSNFNRLKIILGASDNGSNTLELIDVNGTFEGVVTCSANELRLNGYNPEIGQFYVTDLSITQVEPEDLTELDLYDDIPFPLTFKVDDISNPETRQGAFSKTLLIPGTKRNNKIFNHIFDIESDSVFNPNKKLEIVLTKDTYPQFDGILKLNSIVLNDSKQVDYEVTLFSQVTNLFVELGDSLLEDLDFSEYNHELNRTNQFNSWGSSFVGAQGIVINGVVTDNFTETYRGNPSPNGLGYVYCLICNGKGNYTYNPRVGATGGDTSLAQYRVADIGLGFYVYDYMMRIASSAGFTITSDFFESALFKKLVIPPSNKDFLLSTTQVAERLFNVESIDRSITLNFGLTNSGIDQLDTIGYSDIQSDASGGYVSNTWYVQKSGAYNFRAQIGLRWEYENVLLPSGTLTNNAGIIYFPGGAPTLSEPVYTNFYLSEDSKLEVIRLRNGAVTIIGEEAITIEQDQQAITSASGASDTYTFNVNAENIDCLSGDIIYVVLRAKHLLQTDGSLNYNPDRLNVDADGNYYPASGMFIYHLENSGRLVDTFPTWIGNGVNSNKFPLTNNTANIDVENSGTAKLVMRSGYAFFNEVVNNGVTEGTILDVNVYTPKNIKQADFFKWILKMFNCFVLVDKDNPNNLLIEPREDFISTDFENWDNKLDVSKAIEVKPLAELDAKKYIFKYQQDNDYLNAFVLKNTKKVYGTKEIEFDNDFLTDTKELGIGFSPTINARQFANKIALPTIMSESNEPIDANIRIMFYNYADGYEPNWIHVWTTGGTTNYTETYVPALSMFDDLYAPNESLEFGISATGFYSQSLTYPNISLVYTNNTLFNKYYSKYTEELTNKNSRIITAYFNLTPIDIYKLDFSKLYFFANHWCRLYAVEDYDPFVNDTTKVTFLKFNEGVPFAPTYTPVDGGTGWYDEPTGGSAN